jgi:hypothetical protein
LYFFRVACYLASPIEIESEETKIYVLKLSSELSSASHRVYYLDQQFRQCVSSQSPAVVSAKEPALVLAFYSPSETRIFRDATEVKIKPNDSQPSVIL